MAVTILLGEIVTLLIKLYANFRKTNVDVVSCVHRKRQTRAGVSGHINNYIAHSKFSDRVLV